ncbi:unnamed protein product [Urochloa decumbens]|uniref:Leucine-rich repeat-containing N-terminal plant-type domain-containing protein n=1 Tax=Urochloa decumbens TaxID=240449 RepID=A0ABC8VFL0_9POAL
MPLLVLGASLVTLLSMGSLASSCIDLERSSLLKFASELSQDGGLIISWENATDCYKWEGITCSADRTVSDVSLASRSLQGFISASLGNLTSLLCLNLSHNLLSGGMPPELLSSHSIVVLDVSFNQLSGCLQQLQSSSLVPLQVLNISSNLFTGWFPSTTLEAMGNLVAVNASNNSFTGQIPTTFCSSAPSFSVLELSYNQFNGSIPPELGNCSKLTSLNVGHNNLSGTIPNELFNLTLLEHLSFTSNQLEGSLSDMSKLTNLVTFDLGANGLCGNIPDSIGEIPSELMEMSMLKTDKVASMVFELPVYALYTPQSLEYRMPGTFPKVINLGINNFTGVIPKKIGQLKALLSLNLSSNRLSGGIPQSLCNLINLQVLDLSGNHLTGEIPSELNNLHYLSQFNVSNNDLEGSIPISGQLSTFTSSSFDGNPRLCGPMLPQHCGSIEAVFTTEVRIQTDEKVIFAIVFSTFFSVGVLYDRIVLSRFLC